MDPDETLKNLREKLYGGLLKKTDAAELFEALDTWLSRGGFLPLDWAKASSAD